jgi:hypothetical protein
MEPKKSDFETEKATNTARRKHAKNPRTKKLTPEQQESMQQIFISATSIHPSKIELTNSIVAAVESAALNLDPGDQIEIVDNVPARGPDADVTSPKKPRRGPHRQTKSKKSTATGSTAGSTPPRPRVQPAVSFSVPSPSKQGNEIALEKENNIPNRELVRRRPARDLRAPRGRDRNVELK